MSTRPRLLDLFCGGGGASMGYWLAGFEVVGVDIAKRGRYPFAHFQADALEFVRVYGRDFDAIHASPPCQAYSRLAARHPEREYPDLVGPTREALQATGKPYVIENVPEAPLHDPVVLCGSSFALGTDAYQLRRHRAFEANWPLMWPPCVHDDRPVISVAGHAGRAGRNLSGSTAERREAMRIPWLSSDAIAEAIPPDYAYHIGWQLRNHLEAEDLAARTVRNGVCTKCGSGITKAGEHIRNDLPPCYGVSEWWIVGSTVDSVADGGRSSVGSTPGPAAAVLLAPEKFPEGDPVEVRPSDSRAESQAGLNGPSGCPTSPSGRASSAFPPCPFCGGELCAVVLEGDVPGVSCGGCGAYTSRLPWREPWLYEGASRG